jgi:glycosyltransferase involved in cell wall biosynthesis
MKILNVNCTIDKETGGGTAERTLKMSQSLQLFGQECSILSLKIGDLTDTQTKLKDIKFILLPCLIKRFYIPIPTFKVITLIKKSIKTADIIHLMSHWTILNVIVYHYAKKLKKPYVVCPAGAMVIFGRNKLFKKVFNFFIGKSIIRNAAACIAITADEIEQFKQHGVKKKNITHIPNGVSSSDFKGDKNRDFRQQFKLPNKPFILFIGRLNLIKGPDLLLDAYIKAKDYLKDHILVFAGPDEGLQEGLQQKTVELGLESHVKFTGYLNQAQKSRAYYESAFVVIPSRHEAMSIVVLEAGILKKPVLLSDQCGLNNLGENNVAIVKPATEGGICDGLIEMRKKIENEPNYGTGLYQYINDNYTWEIITNKFTSLYENILVKNTESPKKFY